MQYNKPYRKHRRRRPLDFILPFLIIICIGVIGVLFLQLFSAFGDEKPADNVAVHVVSGKARFLPWGVSNWQNIYEGVNLLPGDALRTSQGGKVILEFFNGSLVRIGSDTEIILQEINRDSELDSIVLTLTNGEIWINEKADIGKTTEFSVNTKNLLIKSFGSIFDILNSDYEALRVMDGRASMDVIVYEDEEEKILDTFEVGVGQEIQISDKQLDAFKARENLSLLKAISDDFEESDWYNWNLAEDLDPTEFVYDDVELTISDFGPVSVKPLEVKEEEADTFVDTTPPNAPTIIAPLEDSRIITNGSVTISGNTDPDTHEIVIHSESDGYSDKYTLSKYESFSTEWSYAASEQYGNLKVGENKFYIYAVDEASNRSFPAEIVITYEKPTQEELGALTPPIAVSFNGSLSNEVTVSPVLVKGKVLGAFSISVNDYVLTKFKPGDTEWIYYANEEHGNMIPGFNEYEVYAIGADGQKSEISKFEIIYKKEGTNFQELSSSIES